MADTRYNKRKGRMAKWAKKTGTPSRAAVPAAKPKPTGAKSLTEGTYEKKGSKIVKRGKQYMPEGQAVGYDIDKAINIARKAVIEFKTVKEKLTQGK